MSSGDRGAEASRQGHTTCQDVDALVDSREAVRALAAALGNVDGAGSGTTLFVVLGTQQASGWLMHGRPEVRTCYHDHSWP